MKDDMILYLVVEKGIITKENEISAKGFVDLVIRTCGVVTANRNFVYIDHPGITVSFVLPDDIILG